MKLILILYTLNKGISRLLYLNSSGYLPIAMYLTRVGENWSKDTLADGPEYILGNVPIYGSSNWVLLSKNFIFYPRFCLYVSKIWYNFTFYVTACLYFVYSFFVVKQVTACGYSHSWIFENLLYWTRIYYTLETSHNASNLNSYS